MRRYGEASSIHRQQWDEKELYKQKGKIKGLVFTRKVENLERRQFGLSA